MYYSEALNDPSLKKLGTIKTKLIKSDDDTYNFEVDDEIYTCEGNLAKKKVVGYLVDDENGGYYSITKKLPMLPIIASIVGAVAVCAIVIGVMSHNSGKISGDNHSHSHSSKIEIDSDAEEYVKMYSAAPQTDTIDVPGFEDCAIDAESCIQFFNPDNNTVYFVYTITDVTNSERVVLHQTKAILPGKTKNYQIGKDLSLGNHKVEIAISTFDIETEAACYGATQTITITRR